MTQPNLPFDTPWLTEPPATPTRNAPLPATGQDPSIRTIIPNPGKPPTPPN
jgi:hypothetical protein